MQTILTIFYNSGSRLLESTLDSAVNIYYLHLKTEKMACIKGKMTKVRIKVRIFWGFVVWVKNVYLYLYTFIYMYNVCMVLLKTYTKSDI